MEIHETLKRATEQSLTLEHCRLFLGRSGPEQSELLYGNYVRKYHPKNSSLSSYYHQQVMKHNQASPPPLIRPHKHKSTQSFMELPLLRKGESSLMGQQWESLIKLTDQQKAAQKGTTLSLFPRLDSKMKKTG